MSTVQMSSGFRFPFEIPVGVHSTRFSEMRYEWFPSLPAQNPFSQMRRPISHICSFSFHSLTRLKPFWLLFPLPLDPYAIKIPRQLLCINPHCPCRTSPPHDPE